MPGIVEAVIAETDPLYLQRAYEITLFGQHFAPQQNVGVTWLQIAGTP